MTLVNLPMLREWLEGSHEDQVMTLVEDGSFVQWFLPLVATVEAANRHFESLRGTRAEAMCAQGPLVDLGRLLAEFDFGDDAA